jgi:hypothetical protein
LLIAGLARIGQAAPGNSFVKLVADGTKPVARVHMQWHAGPLGFGQPFDVEFDAIGRPLIALAQANRSTFAVIANKLN